MRDITLMSITLHAIRTLGDGQGRRGHGAGGPDVYWYAGPQPLNGQALWDLVNDGWLAMADDRRSVRLKAWPSFAGDDPVSPAKAAVRNGEASLQALLAEALAAWSEQFDGPGDKDLSISGADLVDWFTAWRLRLRDHLSALLDVREHKPDEQAADVSATFNAKTGGN